MRTPILHHWLSSTQGVSYTSEYQAILDRGTALGYTLPSVAQRTKQNQLVIDLKASGVWALLDVFYNFATDGNSDFATLNWKSPSSNQSTKVNSPTHTANQGFTGNGTTSYVNSNFAPSVNGVNFTQNSASYGGYINNNVQSDICFGSHNASFANAAYLMPRNGANQAGARINDAGTLSMGNASSIGFYHAKRTGANARALFKNGVSIANDTQASQAPNNKNMFIGAVNGNGAAANFSTFQVSCFFAGASLNGLEVSFYNTWNTYFTSL